ncbi:MAG: tRNA (adenosine(37)-N6)-threonylcarbamoyltransferase complex transferase subunit TsaD [Candidatus Dormibacteraceae bacterium]
MSGPFTLAIESSCDESSVAVLGGERDVRSNLIHSQTALHAPHGGVFPELAARDHLERLPGLVDRALAEAAVAAVEVGLVAATRGPGLAGCLICGVGLGEGLAAAWGVEFRGVNHLWGHVYAALLTRSDLEPPLLALVVSGAHTDLVLMRGHGDFVPLGRTRDDAAGEAFDKAARMLGLGYPGGPALERLAGSGRAPCQPLPKPRLPGLEFSFSGLKTALRYRLRDLGESIGEQDRADLAASFQQAVVGALMEKLEAALRANPVREVVVCGGVAANSALREAAAALVRGRARLTLPPPLLCTDNAAMIAAAAQHTPGERGSVDPALEW